MKKIGVITTQYAPNYGAQLQTFALQTYLKKQYGEASAEVVNYFPPHAKDFWRLFPARKGIRNLALTAYNLLNPRQLLLKKKQFDMFRKFIQKNIPVSKLYYSFQELENTEEDYHTLICGSDQIWNITRHDDPNWFLYFSKNWENCKKIAYAPSVADQIPAGHEENLTKYLANLDYISVREDIDVPQLQPYTDKKVHHVCDPVFLLNPAQWSQHLPEPAVKEPYILCYFISTGDFAPKVVEKLRQLTGLKVVHINVNARDKFHSEYNLKTEDPFSLVSYIKNATYVCTNSFHCTAFSILFQKDFLAVRKQTANSRLESLIRVSGLQNRFVDPKNLDSLTAEQLQCDYSVSKMESFIADSKAFLTEALDNE